MILVSVVYFLRRITGLSVLVIEEIHFTLCG